MREEWPPEASCRYYLKQVAAWCLPRFLQLSWRLPLQDSRSLNPQSRFPLFGWVDQKRLHRLIWAETLVHPSQDWWQRYLNQRTSKDWNKPLHHQPLKMLPEVSCICFRCNLNQIAAASAFRCNLKQVTPASDTTCKTGSCSPLKVKELLQPQSSEFKQNYLYVSVMFYRHHSCRTM